MLNEVLMKVFFLMLLPVGFLLVRRWFVTLRCTNWLKSHLPGAIRLIQG